MKKMPTEYRSITAPKWSEKIETIDLAAVAKAGPRWSRNAEGQLVDNHAKIKSAN